MSTTIARSTSAAKRVSNGQSNGKKEKKRGREIENASGGTTASQSVNGMNIALPRETELSQSQRCVDTPLSRVQRRPTRQCQKRVESMASALRTAATSAGAVAIVLRVEPAEYVSMARRPLTQMAQPVHFFSRAPFFCVAIILGLVLPGRCTE